MLATESTEDGKSAYPEPLAKRSRTGFRSRKAFIARRNKKTGQDKVKHVTRLRHRLLTSGSTLHILTFNILTDVNVTKTGWAGKTLPRRTREDITKRWESGEIKEDVKAMLPIPHSRKG